MLKFFTKKNKSLPFVENLDKQAKVKISKEEEKFIKLPPITDKSENSKSLTQKTERFHEKKLMFEMIFKKMNRS